MDCSRVPEAAPGGTVAVAKLDVACWATCHFARPARNVIENNVLYSACQQAWEDGELDSEQREQRGREAEWDRDRPLQMPTPTRWEFPRDKLRLQTLLGQGNFGQVSTDNFLNFHRLGRLCFPRLCGQLAVRQGARYVGNLCMLI